MPAATDSSGGSFLRKAGPLVFARLIAAGITFTIPLVLARAMALEEYGTYKQLFLIAQTLFYILPFGVAQSLYFFIPRNDNSRPWVAQTLLFTLFAGLGAAGLIFAFATPVASFLQNPGLLEYRWELAIYTAGLVASSPLEVMLTAQGRTKHSAVVYLASDALRAACMVVPVFLGYGLYGAMVCMAGFSVVRALAAWAAMVKGTKGPVAERGVMWRQLAYAAPFGAAMLLSIPQQYAHQYAVGAAVTPELFAIYAVGCFQLPLVDLLYTPTSEILMVQVGQLEREGRVREAIHAFKDACARLAYAFLPMAALLFVAAPEFIGALFGTKFLSAVPIFQISVLAVAMSIFPMDGLLRARNETRFLFISYLVKTLVTIPLVFFGVKYLGMMGGILSWAIAELVGKITLLVRVPTALGFTAQDGNFFARVARVLPGRELGKALLSAVGAGVLVVALRSLQPTAFGSLPEGFLWRCLPLALVSVLFVAGYFACLRATGVRPFAILASLRRRPTQPA